jgi:hypothetical protein
MESGGLADRQLLTTFQNNEHCDSFQYRASDIRSGSVSEKNLES